MKRPVAPDMQTVTYRVRGMDCAEEVAALKAELEPLPGIRGLSFDVLNVKLMVEYDGEQIDPSGIATVVARTGMSV